MMHPEVLNKANKLEDGLLEDLNLNGVHVDVWMGF